MTLMKVTINNLRQPAEPKLEIVECAIVELLEIAQRHGITPADFIQLLAWLVLRRSMVDNRSGVGASLRK